jgi:hypothetical protein
MRENLKKLKDNKRDIFIGIFSRFGSKINCRGIERTVLLKDIKHNGEIIEQHCWFQLTNSLYKLKLKEGDVLEFESTVKQYRKGYKGDKEGQKEIEIDYKLGAILNVKKIGNKKEVIK